MDWGKVASEVSADALSFILGYLILETAPYG